MFVDSDEETSEAHFVIVVCSDRSHEEAEEKSCAVIAPLGEKFGLLHLIHYENIVAEREAANIASSNIP